MTSLDAIREVVRRAGDEPIVASLGHPAYDLFAAGDRRSNFYTWGSMGLASSVGLGVAMAQPLRRVYVVDGDGALLMNLGSLATIAWQRPANLVLVVLDNGQYATTGGQDTATRHGADLEAAARAMGFSATATAATTDALADALGEVADASRPLDDRGEGGGVDTDDEAAARLRVHQAALHGCHRLRRSGDQGRTSMSIETGRATLPALAAFVTTASPPRAAQARAATAILDTVGVTLAGASETASRIVQDVMADDRGDACSILGTSRRASAGGAALANGTAAHALDYDDMCFVSLAHPSAPLVSALVAAGERIGAPGTRLIDAYVIGFEIEARLGRLMNPRHYQRGWHCTSTLGTIGAAAAVSRLLNLDAHQAAHAMAIAASEASGLKENFGTMVKPLHAGLAARDGVLAALLAGGGLTASARAIDGSQGFLRAMDSERQELEQEARGSRHALGDRRHRHHGQAVSVMCGNAPRARRNSRAACARRSAPPT